MSSYYPRFVCLLFRLLIPLPPLPSLSLPHQRSFMLPWFFYWKLRAKTTHDQPWIISALLICINCCISQEYNKSILTRNLRKMLSLPLFFSLSFSLFWQMRWLLGDVYNWSEQFTWSANLGLISRESGGERETPNAFDIQELSVDYCCFLFKYRLLLMICQFHAFSPQQDTLVTQKIITEKKKKRILKKIPVECRLAHNGFFVLIFFSFFLPQKPHLDGRRCF